MTEREKAIKVVGTKYAALANGICGLVQEYLGKIEEVEQDLKKPSTDSVSGMLIGRKYAYMEFVENLVSLGKEIDDAKIV